MPCKHRFYSELIPKMMDAEYLFVGTFNPEWKNPNGNNASWFYGRETNLFWCICPHAFNERCLIDKGEKEWREFCSKNKIVITDLVSEITNVDSNSPEDVKAINSFSDAALDKMQFVSNAQHIIKYIKSGNHNLKGVFLTRKTDRGIPNLWREWQSIVEECTRQGIHSAALQTPSLYLTSIPGAIREWKNEIHLYGT